MARPRLQREPLIPTTVSIPRTLLIQARHTAVDERSTLRALMAEGLAHVLHQRQAKRAARPADALAGTTTT